MLGAYPAFGIDSLAVFICFPAIFLVKKRTWLFVILFLTVTLTASALGYAKIDALTTDTATTFKGNPTSFNFEYENITTDDGITTIRFHSNDSWQAYKQIYAQDKGMSFKSFLSKQERCRITENIAYILTNQTINSTIIKILSQNIKEGVLQVQYQCACTDCNLIPSIETRKTLNSPYAVQINYILYPN
ncbi:Uncharacterised protein [uncultured archaeon]|nr:Uncharacterised protein [uncultured archaeon]